MSALKSVSVSAHVFSKYASTSARVDVRRLTAAIVSASSTGAAVKERVVSARRAAPSPGTDTALPPQLSSDVYERPSDVDASSTRTRGDGAGVTGDAICVRGVRRFARLRRIALAGGKLESAAPRKFLCGAGNSHCVSLASIFLRAADTNGHRRWRARPPQIAAPPPAGGLTAVGLAAVASLWRRVAAAGSMDDSSDASDAGSAAAAPAPPPAAAAAAAAASPTTAPPPDATAHPFFQYYASLVHQQNMLADTVRTGAYHAAICGNAADFRDKIVVDVGTGSGVLAFFAARAGARHVYALEASGAAAAARVLLAANGLADRVTVIQARAEDAELPPGVRADVIISEPMGFMLIHERMLESFVAARDRFLRPGGLMFPTAGDILVAPFTDATLHAEQASKVAFWDNASFFGLDLTPLAATAARDHFAQPVVGYVDAASLLAPAATAATIDFATAAPASFALVTAAFDVVAAKTGVCHGLATWFNVTFPGSAQKVVLQTGPSSPGTHWCAWG